MKVVTFGEIMLRLASSDYLRLSQVDNLEVSYAGSEANVAVSLANYNVDTQFVTALPLNPLAERCIEVLRGKNVDVSGISHSGSRIGILYLETGSNMRPSKVFYDREHSSLAEIEPDIIPWDKIFQGATWFHWSGITPAISERAANECLKAVKLAHNLGLTISCDLNYRKTLWNYGKAPSTIMAELVGYCDLIIGNEDDCKNIFGVSPVNEKSLDTDDVVDQGQFMSVGEQMMQRFPNCKKMAVSLRGAINANHNTWGGILYDGTRLLESLRYDLSDIVDRVGGGDSFAAGLIYGMLQGYNDQQALDFAVASSALKHTIKGDFNCVTVDEVISLLSGNNNGRVQR